MSEKMNMLDKDIRELVDAINAHLPTIGYRSSTIARLNAEWKLLVEYADEKGVTSFSIELGRNFAWERRGYKLGDTDGCHNVNRAIHMLADFAQYGMVFKQSSITLKGFTDPYRCIFEGFLEHLRKNGTAENSIPTWRSRLYRLEYFLLNNGIIQFSQIEKHHMFTYVESLSGFTAGTVGATIRILRKLFDYAIINEYHHTNFIDMLPDVRIVNKYRLPNVFTPDEVERILAQVDRDNAMGKRDYAILLLVAKLGLRISDVRSLRFENIDWTTRTISIIQQKTGIPIELPLFDDIGWAIIDYIKHGRPQTECKNIFIRHTAPYDGFSNNLQRMVLKYIQKARVTVSAEKPIGMHTFRHSVATTMLKNGASYEEIAQALGHANPESTYTYTSVDEEQLRKCALEVMF